MFFRKEQNIIRQENVRIALLSAMEHYKKNKGISGSLKNLILDEPEIIIIGGFLDEFMVDTELDADWVIAKKKFITEDDFCRLVSAVAKLKSEAALVGDVVNDAVRVLRQGIDVCVDWTKNGFSSIARKLELLDINTPEKLKFFFQHRAHAAALDESLDKMLANQRYNAVPEYWKLVIRKYWQDEGFWERLFQNPKRATIFTNAISLLCHLEGVVTTENYEAVYAACAHPSLECADDLEKGLHEILSEASEGKEQLLYGLSLSYVQNEKFKNSIQGKLNNFFKTLSETYQFSLLFSIDPPLYQEEMKQVEDATAPPAYLVPSAPPQDIPVYYQQDEAASLATVGTFKKPTEEKQKPRVEKAVSRKLALV